MKLELDEGYQFGMGAFETIAVEKGQPLLLEWHLERLKEALDFLGISRCVCADEVHDYLTGQQVFPAHHALKIIVSAGNTVFTMRPNSYTEETRKTGFSLRTCAVRRNETSPLTRRKTLNYADCLLAKRWALSHDADEALMLNSKGQVSEGSTSNVFIEKAGKLYTPAIECGALPGVARRFVMNRFDVQETVLLPEDVLSADACFVTNSLLGVMPVRSLDGVPIEGRWQGAKLINEALFGLE